MSSAGYGVLRNTFARGTYDFINGTTAHEETRFDAYYFAGEYLEALDGYTKLTGRPHLPPVYALEYGDADCYNRGSDTYEGSPVEGKTTTLDALDTARGFVEHDMPGGWMLVNDGYGCEYVDLPETVEKIEDETGLKTGLWTQRSLTEQPYEVGEAGIRMRKLDVAWVGSGYRMALTACEDAYRGMEDNSDARGTSLMVEGWAGAQRCGMTWTGDHYGDLDAVRWQVSALTGSGNSGQPFATGDVDGIFAGSPESYVRDLQWKAFAPALYSMSGWSYTDKQPWLYGDEATDINRDYLQLRQRLMPYIYSLTHDAHQTGAPVMRHMAIEFPEDLGSYSDEANNQFMLGSDYLVAPVFTSSSSRSGIYLPAGETWLDYWTGRLYPGGQVLNNHPAPLDKLPVFVRSGALVPHGITARNSNLTPEDSELTLQVYPSGSSSYTLYEDDKVTREYQNGAHSLQTFSVDAPESGLGDVTIAIGEREGAYAGKADSRPYRVVAHTASQPSEVTVGGTAVDEVASADALDAATTGWFYDADSGAVTVKAGTLASDANTTVVLKDASAVGGEAPDSTMAQLALGLPAVTARGVETTVTATFSNTADVEKTEVAVALNLPAGWEQVSAGEAPGTVAGGESADQVFVVRAMGDAAPGRTVISATATYLDSAGEQNEALSSGDTEVTYGSLADAFNHVSITTEANAADGNFDGGGASFAAQSLEALGITPGSELTVTTGDVPVTYQWAPEPDEENAVAVDGQTISLSGKGTHLAVVGSSATAAGVTGAFTIHYTDGSSSVGSAGFPNWLYQAAHGTLGSTVAVEAKGRNNASAGFEYGDYSYQMYQNFVPLHPAKTVQSVTLPPASSLKLFAWEIVEKPLPEVPLGVAYASDLEWISATNGYGEIGRDTANIEPGQTTGQPLKSHYLEDGEKKVYSKGLGVHADGSILYHLGGECTSFTAEVGHEDGYYGPVVFSVASDGQEVFRSRSFVEDFTEPDAISLDVSGVDFIELKIQGVSGIGAAHGIWGDAKFICGEDTEAPDPEPSESPSPEPSESPSPEPSESPSPEPSESPSPEPSESPSPEPSKSPSPKPSAKPTAKPTAVPTDPGTPPAMKPTPVPTDPGTLPATKLFEREAPYTKPGTHTINDRQWVTECEEYSQTERCRTDIWATVVKIVDGQFVRESGWAFNNLTYLPYMTRAAWVGNPLGDLGSTVNGEFESAGRQWKTECDTAATGSDGCRSYTMTTVYKATAKPEGGYTFSQSNEWVFNNIVMFGGPEKRG